MAADIAKPSICTVVLKWLCSILFGIVLLVCLIESKLGILVISNAMRQTTEMRYIRFVMLFIMVLVPSVVNLMRGIWCGDFRHNIPWPSKPALLWGLFVSLLEALGLCLFVFHIPGIKGMDQPCKVILIMNGVHLCPALYNIWQAVKERKKNYSIVRSTFAIIFIVAFVVITFFILLENVKVKDAWTVPFAMLCLSLAWTPAVQKQLVEPFIDQSDNGEVHPITETKPWKLTIYLSCLKIIFTVATSLLLFFFLLFENQPTLANFKSGWSGLVKYTWTSSRDDIYYFTATIIGSAVGYLIAYIACTAFMQGIAFSLPLVLATPVSILLLVIPQSCDFLITNKDRGFVCEAQGMALWLIFAAVVCLLVYQFAPVRWYLLQTQSTVLQKETKLFWVPTYNSVLLEQWLILARKNSPKGSTAEEKKCKIVMCTTMYRETDREMRELLKSLQSVTLAQKYGGKPFECHIFFDNGVKESQPTKFVLRLMCLIESTLGLEVKNGCKKMTPYGMAWNTTNGDVDLTIHMKDNKKVKSKKRWSQVMYMSYILDKLDNSAYPDETYILTTDGDVSFTSNSVEALLDLMTRDHTVGAVCARTHPRGTGHLVWYQTFEYAIGHWFQKAAEHVIGSVLCSPGCFSVYRCHAIRIVLPEYATDVNDADDFLTKDMGEDRWLCTLLVQNGWRIEYCAASENSTYCPDDFDEFFKQRRRWIASTLANMMLFLGNWRTGFQTVDFPVRYH